MHTLVREDMDRRKQPMEGEREETAEAILRHENHKTTERADGWMKKLRNMLSKLISFYI